MLEIFVFKNLTKIKMWIESLSGQYKEQKNQQHFAFCYVYYVWIYLHVCFT